MNIFLNSISSLIAVVNTDDLSYFQQKIYDAYSGGGFTSDLLTRISEVMKLGQGDLDIISNIWNIFLPLAYSLIALYFVMNLLDRATISGGMKELGMEYWIGALLKLILAEGLLYYGFKLTAQIMMLGNAILASVVDYDMADTSLGEIYLQALHDACKSMSILTCIAQYIYAVLIDLVNTITYFVLLLQAAAKKFEVIIMCSFMGIAAAQCFSESGRNGAIRYIKKLIACMIHMGAIILIVEIAFQLSQGTVVTSDMTAEQAAAAVAAQLKSLSASIEGFLYKFAAIGSISVAKSIINDAIGV